MSSIAAMLLAAGRSSRMGAFKPLLPFGGRSVAEACINSLMRGGVETIVCVLGTREQEMRERLSHLPLRFSVNADAASEMGVSIARGMEQVPREAEAVLIALCDQPAVPSSVIRTLAEERARTGARLIVPEHCGRGGHPVLIDCAFRERLQNLDREKGLRALFDSHRPEVLRVPVASPFVVRDMDTWDDYRALHLDLFGVEPPLERP